MHFVDLADQHPALGAKPTSVYGAVNTGNATAKRVQEGCDAHYPALQPDLERLRSNPGLMALILDNLIDREPLVQCAEASEPHQQSASNEASILTPSRGSQGTSQMSSIVVGQRDIPA